MERFKRSNRDYGSGSGLTVFENEFFTVVLWGHYGIGKRTTLSIRDCDIEIQFDGKVSLKSNKACFAQLNMSEIKQIISSREKLAFERGKYSKTLEFRRLLAINDLVYE